MTDGHSNSSATYVQGRLGEETEDSKGSAAYILGRPLTDPGESSGGYIKPQSKGLQDDIVCNSCGLLKDKHGYLILTSSLPGKHGREQNYYKPVPAPRPDSDCLQNQENAVEEGLQRQRGCGRITCGLLICLIVLLLVSIAGNVYQFVNKSTDPDNRGVVQTPICPQTVTLQSGVQGHISCHLQYLTMNASSSIEIYLIDIYANDRITFLSEQQILTNDRMVESNAESGTNTEVKFDTNGRIEVEIVYDAVKCCSHGDLYINISGFIVVKILVTVEVDLPCPRNLLHNVNTVNIISCTQCLCTENSTVQPSSNATWIYNHTSTRNATQPGRVSIEQAFNSSTSLITYNLLFNRTACFDGGSYTLITSRDQNSTQKLEFIVQISGVTFGPLARSRSLTLLSETRIDGTAVCISNNPTSFLSSHNLTYMFIGDDDSLEVLQAENISVVSNTREGFITSIPATQQSYVITPYIQDATQFRPSYINGMLGIDVYFNKVQCYHGGQYLFYVDGVLLYNLTVLIDDSAERTQTVIYQKAEETGFVETYNITIECAASVGCTKRPYVIEPEIDTNKNTTFNHTLTDIDSDGLEDIFIATITSTVLDIPLSLNNTNFTCRVTGDSFSQELAYTIYVLEGTFCDSRPTNCEYEYPYRTDTTCKLWVSCLDERPRVKMCPLHNTFYHKDGDLCSGTCSFGCPWNL